MRELCPSCAKEFITDGNKYGFCPKCRCELTGTQKARVAYARRLCRQGKSSAGVR